MPNIGLNNKIFGLYRNDQKLPDTAASLKPCICQYTRLDKIGRDFNAFEILCHIILRIYPAIANRISHYTGILMSTLKKITQCAYSSPPANENVIKKKNFYYGDIVKISTYPEIAKTLNSKKRHTGLSFMNGMKSYCGTSAMVRKEPLNVLDHGGRKIQKCKNIVICDRLYCNGTNIKCDRSCLYYWKKDWLKETS